MRPHKMLQRTPSGLAGLPQRDSGSEKICGSNLLKYLESMTCEELSADDPT
jgi:hypothetical protein